MTYQETLKLLLVNASDLFHHPFMDMSRAYRFMAWMSCVVRVKPMYPTQALRFPDNYAKPGSCTGQFVTSVLAFLPGQSGSLDIAVI
jgi:hypothetical protein